MKKYTFKSKTPPHNRIVIEAENEAKAKIIFAKIFGNMDGYELVNE